MTAKANKTVDATTMTAKGPKVDVAGILAQVKAHLDAIGGDLGDRNPKGRTVASRIAKKLNAARAFSCPTAMASHQGFPYWTGADVLAFVAKHG